jgi:hypothetical protein
MAVARPAGAHDLTWRVIPIAFLTFCVAASSSLAQDTPYPDRKGLTYAEGTPPGIASCAELSKTIKGFVPPPEERVDLWSTGPVTLVHTDDVLWYIAICSEPGVRVLCVTYSRNDMEIGDVVTVRGAMRVQDNTHVVLDPCLSSAD